MSSESLVRRYFTTFLSDDEKAMKAMMSDDFTFSSPRDDHIDRNEFFRRCWPHRHELRALRIEELFASDDEAFVRYEAEPKSGAPFRNVEFLRIDGPKVRAVEVYFGPSEKRH